ncbi:MAG: hypothetical protein WC898_04040 [Candidatus Paceibacterota bacterium]|jgi:hypothetical protein
MRDKPILFSTEMVKAILEGRKTQTRRIIKEPYVTWMYEANNPEWWKSVNSLCPYQIGQILWVPSIFMPREAARLFLKIKNIRVERLQDITAKDAIAEGIDHKTMNDPRIEFQWLWDSINAKRGYPWGSNPYVWVYEFKVKEEV